MVRGNCRTPDGSAPQAPFVAGYAPEWSRGGSVPVMCWVELAVRVQAVHPKALRNGWMKGPMNGLAASVWRSGQTI